jgi:hypothetical protein
MQRFKGLLSYYCCCESAAPGDEVVVLEVSKSPVQDSYHAGLLQPQQVNGKLKTEISSLSRPSEKSEEVGLDLQVIESATIEVGKLYKVRPDGVVGLEAALSDGAIQFGTTNDASHVVLPEEEGMGSSHFSISYIEGAYYIQDLGKGTGTFIRIDSRLKLKNRYVISFGDNHMGVSINHSLTTSTLSLRFLDGPMSSQEFEFNQTEVVKVGRTAECQVRSDTMNMSRVQCIIQYSEEQGWTILDGDGIKGSTNSTWLYIDEPFMIAADSVFKAGQTLFVAKHAVL